MNPVYETALTVARIKARECGYAIGLHGSQVRDLDLIAVPWTDQATSAAFVSRHIAHGIFEQFEMQESADRLLEDQQFPYWCSKPHGRRAYTIQLPGCLWIDLSVIPCATSLQNRSNQNAT